jgi:hypothetical protein
MSNAYHCPGSYLFSSIDIDPPQNTFYWHLMVAGINSHFQTFSPIHGLFQCEVV